VPMVPFCTRFSDLAFKEMRTVQIQGSETLPDGVYGFLELYCDEVDCDCRRVIIQVISPDREGMIWATIGYGWESVEFYQKAFRPKQMAEECKGPSLDPLNAQTPYSSALLHLFEGFLEDEAYVERLKRHYNLFKNAIEGEHRRKKKRRQKS